MALSARGLGRVAQLGTTAAGMSETRARAIVVGHPVTLSEWERSSRARNQLGLTMLDGARAVVELVRKPPSPRYSSVPSGMLPERAMPVLYGDLVSHVRSYDGRGAVLTPVPSAVAGEVCEKHDMDFAIVSSDGDHR